MAVIFKIESEIWGPSPPKKNGGPKHQNFGFRDLIANISGQQQDIVDRKTALEIVITPYEPAKFGELWSTNGEK